MGKFYEQDVRIKIPKDSDLYRRIKKEAQETCRDISDVVSLLARWGIYNHIESNLNIIARNHNEHLKQYLDALDVADPAMREEILRQATMDPDLSCFDLKKLMAIAYPDSQ